MKVYNFGSINIDEVYRVKEIVKPGETISSYSVHSNYGGKGLNQSIACSRAGLETVHIGYIYKKDVDILRYLDKEGISTQFISESDVHTGKAFIQLADSGENSIVLSAGGNNNFTKDSINYVFDNINEKSFILTQNETNLVDHVLSEARVRGHTTILNMAPINDFSRGINLNNVDYLIVNEHEGRMLSGKSDTESILRYFTLEYPEIKVILTLGKNGVVYHSKSEWHEVDAVETNAIDTTAAGDTFVGYFISGIGSKSVVDSLQFANYASSITIQHLGSSETVPFRKEVEEKINGG